MDLARILVVDDEDKAREVVAELIRALGHEVETASGGREAIAILETGRYFDAVFTDFNMPERNGIEVMRAARLSLPAVKLVLMTGGSLSKEVEHIIRAVGADGVLSKPVTSEEISALFERFFPRPS